VPKLDTTFNVGDVVAYRATFLLVERDKWLYVVEEYPHYDEPRTSFYFYPIGVRAADFTRNWGRDLPLEVRSCGPDGGLYSTAFESDGRGLRFRLENAGRTTATFVEEIALPCPPVRRGVETRFHGGAWQKYLRQKGWVAA
jgi:hypothetical protein